MDDKPNSPQELTSEMIQELQKQGYTKKHLEMTQKAIEDLQQHGYKKKKNCPYCNSHKKQ
ncbi:hypothetical protein COL21_13465 [Bacillus thuringiensis]|uniref:hypothetical protein n=1 Tax=Bacillus thuringiensis TaxID=1428 RepID=UPI000BF64D50|nr:hypothetical protein [Bacillus thuringiensis]PFV97053.1 hypothetical protein COL21_13465 [Bacillus thuringiensis]PGR86636.1 hypothetical protein COC68_32085 [Bacillus thuringiensis]